MSTLQNPGNLSVQQALLDLFTFLNNDDKKTLKDLMDRNSKEIKQASQKFDAHQYPTSKLTFGKLTNMQAFPLYSINVESTDAINVFICLCNALNSTNNHIQIKLSVLKDLTCISLSGIRKAIKVLIEYGFIAVYAEATNREPAIYIINPELYRIGHNSCDFHDCVSEDAIRKFEEMKKANASYVNEKIARTEKSEARTVVRLTNLKEQLCYEEKVEQKKSHNP